MAVHEPLGRDGSSRGPWSPLVRPGVGPPGRLCGFAIGPVVGPERLAVGRDAPARVRETSGRAVERRDVEDVRGAPGRLEAVTP